MVWAMLETVTIRGSLAFSKWGKKMGGEGKMAQMVGADLEFKPICSGAFRWNHDAGVVDEDVKVRRAGDELIRRLLQRVLRLAKIEVEGADDGFGVPGTDSFQCVRGLGLVAARKNNSAPLPANSIAISNPMPVFAPVMRTIFSVLGLVSERRHLRPIFPMRPPQSRPV